MSSSAPIQFRLYLAGDSLNSLQAVANLRAICQAHLPGRHAIELVDVFAEPRRALADAVFMTPTLLKLSPQPGRRIVGNLSQTRLVLDTLAIAESP